MMLTVNTNPNYNVIIEPKTLDYLEDILKEYFPNSRFCIVCDENVSNIFKDQLIRLQNCLISSKDISPFHIFVYPGGESHKTLTTVSNILEFLAENKFNRNDVLIAFGGGITGDIVGFSASCYKRGIKYIQIPTTLLASIDSSVGGKTAVNLPQGKNLCGAFYPPSLVICDTDIIKNLPQNIFLEGISEILKYGILFDEKLFCQCENGYNYMLSNIEKIIYKCILLKAKTVELDEFDTAQRLFLNLGHTTAHAIEILSDYKVSHGYAVGVGLCTAAKISQELGLCHQDVANRIISACKTYHLPTDFKSISEISAELCILKEKGIFVDNLLKEILNDKKIVSSNIRFILPTSIGSAIIKDFTENELYHILQRVI